MEEKPLLLIGDNGIEINLKEGDLINTNSSQTFMKGVKQNVDGGVLEHHALEELVQIGNTSEVANGGKITNEVGGGRLIQIDNKMKANRGGAILNRVSLRDENITSSEKVESFFEKFFWTFIIGVAVVVVGGYILHICGWV